jgi:anti-anti-sigma factor
VILKGDLDFAGTAALRDVLAVLDGPGTLDMRAVRYIDCSALSEFVRLAKRVGAGRVTLIIAAPIIRKVLEICGFQCMFRIEDAS